MNDIMVALRSIRKELEEHNIMIAKSEEEVNNNVTLNIN